MGATVMESPVWTPMGSKFSMEQMMTQLSALSRITSISNSFQPSRDSSMRISETGESSGHDGDIVARAHAAILADVPHERGFRGARRQRRFRRWKFVIESQFLESQIVRVNVPAGRDLRRRAPDALTVALHLCPRVNRAQGDLVARGN